MSSPLQLWLEPGIPGSDLEQGLRARVADPVWFMTRQWRLGELQGEDASSPVGVRVEVTHERLRYDPRRPTLDPTVVPAEALIEAEPGDWWTIGRRIRLGRGAAPLLGAFTAAQLDALRFGELPTPYQNLSRAIDGRKVFVSGLLPGHALWANVPSPAADRWSGRTLCHEAPFAAGKQRLLVADHDGGDVDWYSVDGQSNDVVAHVAAPVRTTRTVMPGRMEYPGAPRPRWWEIEDHAVDLGGYSPDRSHLASLLLYDVALAHSDDWFWLPVPTPEPGPDGSMAPSSGVVVTVHTAIVRDSFGDEWPLQAPPDWSLFRTADLPHSALVVWPVAVAPHRGPVLDEVMLGVDEDANLAWAVELRADGLALAPDARTDDAIAQTRRTGTRHFRYLPSTALPRHWHPYRREHAEGQFGAWEQGLVADLTLPVPRTLPGPQSRLIGGPSGPGAGRGHVIDGHAIASSGLVLRRQAMLARDTRGQPVLWVQRSSQPLLGPPASHLRFDVMAEAAGPESEAGRG